MMIGSGILCILCVSEEAGHSYGNVSVNVTLYHVCHGQMMDGYDGLRYMMHINIHSRIIEIHMKKTDCNSHGIGVDISLCVCVCVCVCVYVSVCVCMFAHTWACVQVSNGLR